MRMIDPPSGWKYGFPKPVPQEVFDNNWLAEWLVEQGYPQSEVELALQHSRYWDEE